MIPSRTVAAILALAAFVPLAPIHARAAGDFGSRAARASAVQPADEPITRLLADRATAVERGDAAAFERTLALADPDFLARQRTWFRRIRSLPLGTYRLAIATDEFGDLAAPDDRRGFDEVRILQVDETIGLRGYDRKPAVEDLYLTFARKGDRWSVIADTDGEALGLLTMRNLWDFGDVQTIERDRILAVFHPAQRAAIPAILERSVAARARAKRDWPFAWNDPIVVMVPSTVAELERILQTTFDLTQFVAFAASSLDRSKDWDLTGNRVFLHWENFRKYSGTFQTSVLAHEFLHLATRDMAGPHITAIFDEGVAQHYGEGGGETTLIRRRVRNRTLPGSLVPDWFFIAGPRDDIFLAYEEAASFFRFLARRFGADAGARAYKALGEIDPLAPGTWRYHLDRVTQSLFGRSFPSLERDWFRSVMEEHS